MNIVLYKSMFKGPSDGAAETLISYAIHLVKSGNHATVLLMSPSKGDHQYTDRLKFHGISYQYVSTGEVFSVLNVLLRFGRALYSGNTSLFRSTSKSLAGQASAYAARHYYRRCRALLESSELDLLHVLDADAGAPVVIEAAQSLGVPVLFHELRTPNDRPDCAPYNRRLGRALSRQCRVAALSPRLAASCRDHYAESGEITVLPLIVEDLSHRMRERPESGTVTFGFSGRIELLKGSEALARAFVQLHREFPGVRLKIAGTGEQEGPVAKILEQGGAAAQCDFTGAYLTVEEKSDFMHGLDVLVHPSLSEGTPNSIIEAMSVGLPVIASAVGGIPDVVSSASGILVPPEDVDALTEAMRRLVVDPELRQRLGSAGRQRYERLFSVQSVLPLLLQGYRNIALHRPARAADGMAEPSGPHPWVLMPGSREARAW